MSSAWVSVTSSSSFPSLSLQHLKILVAASSILVFLSGVFAVAFLRPKVWQDTSDAINGFGRFFYASFLKPHTGDALGGQQGALESFYKAQV